jgi:CheY-like chemotaxis protein
MNKVESEELAVSADWHEVRTFHAKAWEPTCWVGDQLSFEVAGVTGKIEKFSILIADDDDVYRSALRDIFEPRGYRTLLAANGQEAIAILEDTNVHCLLLDMHMPDLTGLETLQIVRQVRATLPCIMLTADASQQILRQALSLQAFSVLTKPVSRELVTVTVRRALESAYRSA